MEAQVAAGRAKAIGLSNFNPRQIERLVENAKIKPANLQASFGIS
jgi:alcohol dehydrogenase (NADP+)